MAVIDSPIDVLAEGARATRSRPRAEALQPNLLVCWAFYLSVFAIPFVRVYLPGTGDRIGITRLAQALILAAVLSQPRVCLRFVPTALLWFAAYCAMRILTGLWLTPEMREAWWPRTLEWLQFALPWLWIMFNVLQFPNQGRKGLWAFAGGCSLCALFHVVGIGVIEVDQGLEGRSAVFGQNANAIGATYAIALVVLVALGMLRGLKPGPRLLTFPMIAMVAIALAKTGSRSAALILAMGMCVLFLQGQAFGSKTKRFGILLLFAAIVAGVAWQIPTVTKRFEQLDASNLGRQEGRVRMAPVLFEMFTRSPVFGSGPAGYEFELTRRAMPHMVKSLQTITAHNLVLKLLVETGIIGLLLFATGVKPALAGAWRARLKSCGSLPLALLAPLVIGGAIFSDPSHNLTFWFAIAYALAGEKTC